jgi:hypothetical protein
MVSKANMACFPLGKDIAHGVYDLVSLNSNLDCLLYGPVRWNKEPSHVQ